MGLMGTKMGIFMRDTILWYSVVLLCDISVIFPSLGGFHCHGDIFSPVYGWKNSDISWKSTPKNKDGFWVAMLTRKVLNNGRTYSCGYVFLWDLGMLAVSKALEEEEFKQTLRYNPKTCVLGMLCCPHSQNWRLLEDSQIPKYHLDDFVHRFMDFQSMD